MTAELLELALSTHTPDATRSAWVSVQSAARDNVSPKVSLFWGSSLMREAGDPQTSA